jgi:hypothetical protein
LEAWENQTGMIRIGYKTASGFSPANEVSDSAVPGVVFLLEVAVSSSISV